MSTQAPPGRIRIAADTGGTFTDIVAWDGGHLTVHKLPSTPGDPSAAVLAGVAAVLAAGGAAPALLIHGSTVATNALLEGRVARTAVVTNRGFEDLLVIGRQARPRLYALHTPARAPLVAEGLRLGVAGRLDESGAELEPLDGDAVARLVAQVQATGAESVAVALLHSYANPAHESALAAAIRGVGLPCSVSSELLPEHREYERMATTVVNAAVAPLMAGYLRRLEGGLPAVRVLVMGSAGGAISVARASEAAAETVLSGPAGGVAGALHVAARHGFTDILTFDMGGTSTDVSLCPGRPLHTREFTVAGLPVALPFLDIHTVGAGGGSVARVDAAGALRVGPESAGAEPGPACYGRGGTRVTVTDANVALGRLVPGEGILSVRPELVEGPLRELARGLGCSPGEAAEGVVAVANSAMEGALRVISVERGHDPAAFTLVPFGGAAGLHAVALAERLEIPRLLLPPAPGVLSAFGMLVAPARRDAARSVHLADPADEALEELFRGLDAAALEAIAGEVAGDDVALHRTVAARYRGQSHELVVPAPSWREAFHAAHRQRFGYAREAEPVEVITLRSEAVAPQPPLPAPVLAPARGRPRPAATGPVLLDGRTVQAEHHRRESLGAGHLLHGPAILLEATATFWLPPHWQGEVLGDGSVLVQRA
jgi:N-methylhydantoinase A